MPKYELRHPRGSEMTAVKAPALPRTLRPLVGQGECHILALDPSLHATGYAARATDGRWMFGHECTLPMLILRLQVAKENGCDTVVCEDTYLGPNPATFKKLSVLQGQIRSECERLGMRFITVAPMTWKVSMLTVNRWMPKRRADQKKVAMWVATQLGAAVDNDNEADAVCICEWAMRMDAAGQLEPRCLS